MIAQNSNHFTQNVIFVLILRILVDNESLLSFVGDIDSVLHPTYVKFFHLFGLRSTRISVYFHFDSNYIFTILFSSLFFILDGLSAN